MANVCSNVYRAGVQGKLPYFVPPPRQGDQEDQEDDDQPGGLAIADGSNEEDEDEEDDNSEVGEGGSKIDNGEEGEDGGDDDSVVVSDVYGDDDDNVSEGGEVQSEVSQEKEEIAIVQKKTVSYNRVRRHFMYVCIYLSIRFSVCMSQSVYLCMYVCERSWIVSRLHLLRFSTEIFKC